MKTCCQHQTATPVPVLKTKVTQGLCPGIDTGLREEWLQITVTSALVQPLVPFSEKLKIPDSVLIVCLVSANLKADTQGGEPVDRLDGPSQGLPVTRAGWHGLLHLAPDC